MAQFTCEICGESFEQKSRIERHMQTSHPPQALTAADLEKALRDIDFPKTKDELLDVMEGAGREDVADVVERMPQKEYRDAAEVGRAFGELRSHEKKSGEQPSRKGGERAKEAFSATRLAQTFRGMDFPASGEDLKNYARENAGDEIQSTIEKFRHRTYKNMADVEREFGRLS